jgi:negative regulator of sigma E activity
MNDPIKEQLSAFLDGELPPGEAELLLRRLEREPQAFERHCASYLLIGAAMRREHGAIARGSLPSRVRAAVDTELHRPATTTAARRRPPGWLRAAAGMAVAAGVAAIAIMGLQLDAPQTAAVTASMSVPDRAPAPVATELLADVPGDPSYVVPSQFRSDAPLVATRLTNYVVAHSEYSSPLGRRNVLTGLLSDDAVVEPAGGPDPDTIRPAAEVRR